MAAKKRKDPDSPIVPGSEERRSKQKTPTAPRSGEVASSSPSPSSSSISSSSSSSAQASVSVSPPQTYESIPVSGPGEGEQVEIEGTLVWRRRKHPEEAKREDGLNCPEEGCPRKTIRESGYCATHGGHDWCCSHDGCDRLVKGNQTKCDAHEEKRVTLKKSDKRNKLCRFNDGTSFLCFNLRKHGKPEDQRCDFQMCEMHDAENYCTAREGAKRCRNFRYNLFPVCKTHKAKHHKAITTDSYKRDCSDNETYSLEVRAILQTPSVQYLEATNPCRTKKSG